jgi:hypothetical protein
MEAEVQTALSGLCADPQAATWNWTEWTRHIKAAIGHVASNHGLVWRSSHAGGEFIFDGVALQRDNADNLVSVPIALESEWMGKAKIKEDFEKLLASNTGLRVMACSAESCAGVLQHFVRLRTMVDAFTNKRQGDRYLLAGWYGRAQTTGQFVFESYVAP